jgi:hypothetical protein
MLETPEARLLPVSELTDEASSNRLHALAPPSAIRPGELWLVEHSSTDSRLPPLVRHAITSADVVIYDRALYSAVAANLPVGGYAEPASWPHGAVDIAADRCIQFSRDGWSVVRLADHAALRDGGISRLVKRMVSAGCPVSMSVRVFANAAGNIPRQTETELGNLGTVIDSTAPEVHITIAFAAIGTGVVPHFYAISSNGLAG